MAEPPDLTVRLGVLKASPAVHLYERAGFRMEHSRLCVLALDLRR